ncbi:MAG: HAMP domain-containing histidine kinase [Myxococcales bacterium]|nr:HAMP domain-containing histidine kinase [Myxococcales bacterium]
MWPVDPRVDLAAGLVHDFDNLLSVVASSAEGAMELLPPDHPATADLELTAHAVRRLAELSRNLLGVLTRSADVLPPDYRSTLKALEPVLRSAVGPRVSLVVRDDDVPPTSISTLDFERIVLNLVFNARNAIGSAAATREDVGAAGHIEIVLERVAEGQGAWMQLSVADDGPGVPPRLRSRLFDAGVGTGTGSGIGLTVVRRVVRDAGGTIEVGTPPGGGSRFVLRVPARPGRAP